MSWSKKQLLIQSFTEIGLADYVYDLTPQEMNSALLVMETLIAEWEGLGIRLNYPICFEPSDANINADSGLPMYAIAAVYLNTAVRIAASYGKVVQKETILNADTALRTLYVSFTQPPLMQYPGTIPAGAGNKYWRYNGDPFVRRPVGAIAPGPDSIFDFLGPFQNQR